MSNPTKAAPREKSANLTAKRYRVTNTTHFINGSLVAPGGIVQLPADVKPGKHLVEVDEAGKDVKAKAPPAEPQLDELDTLLAKSVAAISEAIPGLSDAELVELAEREGKRKDPRVSLATVIEAEQKKRAAPPA